MWNYEKLLFFVLFSSAFRKWSGYALTWKTKPTSPPAPIKPTKKSFVASNATWNCLDGWMDKWSDRWTGCFSFQSSTYPQVYQGFFVSFSSFCFWKKFSAFAALHQKMHSLHAIDILFIRLFCALFSVCLWVLFWFWFLFSFRFRFSFGIHFLEVLP